MKYCHQCGKMLEDHVKFCTACGVPQEEATQPANQPAPAAKKPKKGRKIFIGCLIVLVVGLVAAVVLLGLEHMPLQEGCSQ